MQEAHNMVREANMRQATAERALKESQMQVEVLTAEVSALKTLVLTSTPSRPNPHLHPQIDSRGNRPKDDSTLSGTIMSCFTFPDTIILLLKYQTLWLFLCLL